MVEDRPVDAADARWLLDEADHGDWSRPALTALAASRGWRPVDAAADPSAAPPALFTPGVPRATTWKQWQAWIPRYLAPLPAETLALGEHVDLHLFSGSTSRLRITSSPDGELSMRASLRAPDDPALAGWNRTADRYASWGYDAGGPGEVDADQLARLIVATLRAEKVRSLSRLVLIRGTDVHWSHFGLFLR